MDIDRFEKNAQYANAVIHNGLVYVSGQYGERSLDESIEAQTEETLNNISRVLEAVGSSTSNLLSTCVYLDDIDNFDVMNRIWSAWVDPESPPARATVESRLADKRMRIEISCIATLA